MATIYEHTGEGPVVTRATSAKHAADIIARREFGKRGFCRTIRLDSYTRDGSVHTYEAFIGRPVRGERGTTTGRNVWIYERRGEG